jgi:Cdc6-like AAA superfamily ATPase
MRSTDRPAFVGRTGPLLQIVRLLRAAERGGGGQLAVLHGPAGIGKTRLAEEVMDRARSRGCRVAIGRCWNEPAYFSG